MLYETGVYRAKSDYRVPDLVFFPADRTEIIGELGLVGAPLAVLEIRSPGDETGDKLDFWAALGVPEVLVIEPETRKVEVYRLAGPRYLATSAGEQGRIHAATIDVRLSTTEGPRLRVELAGETCEI